MGPLLCVRPCAKCGGFPSEHHPTFCPRGGRSSQSGIVNSFTRPHLQPFLDGLLLFVSCCPLYTQHCLHPHYLSAHIAPPYSTIPSSTRTPHHSSVTPRDHPSACLDACPPHMHVTTVFVYAVSPVYTSTLALALVHFTLKSRQWQLSPCTARTASHGSCGEFRAHRPPAPAHPPAPCDQCGAAPRSTVVGGGPEGSETHGPLVPDVQERPR